MKLALAIPVINHRQETVDCIDSFKGTADSWPDIELMLIDNGSEVPVLEWGIVGVGPSNVIRNEQNAGVLPALQQAYEGTAADYILYTHNDVTIFEQGWDTKIKRILGELETVGVAGFFGAKGIGTPQLYREPYQMNQLVRVDNISGCHRMPSGHNYRLPRGEWEAAAVMDGFCLIVSRKFLDENGGFDLNLPPHHNYDNHTCLQSLDRGFRNIVISMDAYHHGGVTDVSEPWNEVFGKSKADIHRDAHYPYFYEYWRPGRHDVHLPLYIA